jgi:hypothetical protein
MSKPATETKITADDVERKLRAFQGQIQGKVDDKKSTLMTVGAGVGVFLLILVFLLGKRSGKKRSTIVQIKRL